MSLVKDTLRTSTITEELSDAEVEVIGGLFGVEDYKSGDKIVQPGDKQADNLYILAHGDIEVRIASAHEESIIHVLKPGDLAGTSLSSAVPHPISAQRCTRSATPRCCAWQGRISKT